MSGLFTSIIAFIVAIGLLVTFHELGHFSLARLLGVKVLRFSIGFGKTLWRFQDRHKTEYVIAALPLGGYVKMLDEREGPVAEHEKSAAFNQKPLWARTLIVLAGPVFNFLFAIIAYWLMYMIGITGLAPIVGELKPHSIAAVAGLEPKDEILKVDGITTSSWQRVTNQLLARLGDKETLSIEVLRDGQHETLSLKLATWQLKGDRPDLVDALGIIPYQPPIPPLVHEVIPDEPAAKAGIRAGDVIIAVNREPISAWQDFTRVVVKSINKPMILTVKRQNETQDITFKPRARESDTGEMIGYAGIVVKSVEMPPELLRKERLGPIAAFVEANKKTAEYIRLTFRVIAKMITGDVGLKTLSGPLTIAEGAGASASFGIQYYLGFLALISISLGVLNLLPIPILDGGHLLYFLIEAIQGKPVSERVQLYGFKLGMLLLIFLMSVAFYNDLARIF
ncbi:sigma E protease regulator RseP [Candidatus Berkiella aquae]|uniref:Zinc metalloprotease n=1 Tax=Candidatus Berkiella aquae TaxID=295108 RepID=A0A0Q9YKE9_9GAMM|nr:sigma E protease regulator RseP [Candidatus Berkiella aquae]MCS5711159.1 sigma E protease regulator RseP [Candidatus Berkiella aquae]